MAEEPADSQPSSLRVWLVLCIVVLGAAAAFAGVGTAVGLHVAGGPLETVYQECQDVSLGFRDRTVCTPVDPPRTESRASKVTGGILAGLIFGGLAGWVVGGSLGAVLVGLSQRGLLGAWEIARPALMLAGVAGAIFGPLFLLPVGWQGRERLPVGLGLCTFGVAIIGTWLVIKVVRPDTTFWGEDTRRA